MPRVLTFADGGGGGGGFSSGFEGERRSVTTYLRDGFHEARPPQTVERLRKCDLRPGFNGRSRVLAGIR